MAMVHGIIIMPAALTAALAVIVGLTGTLILPLILLLIFTLLLILLLLLILIGAAGEDSHPEGGAIQLHPEVVDTRLCPYTYYH